MPLLPTVPRTELLNDLFDSGPRLLKIVAPAGFGKSRVARELAARFERSAIADFGFAETPIEVLRALIDGLSMLATPEQRATFADQSMTFGDDVDGWTGFAGSYLREVNAELLVLENMEHIAGKRDLLRPLEAVLRKAPADLRTIVCARTEPGLRLGRFAGPDRSRRIGADELRFARSQIAALFADLALPQGGLDAIERFSRGWPIVVMMLYTLARRGRLGAYLNDTNRDVADLYDYLAAEVYQNLDAEQAAVLEVAAAIPEARLGDLAAYFAPADYTSALEALERDTPFVNRRPPGIIDVHPALRQMLSKSQDHDSVLARLYECVDRSDGGIRAAQIALYRHRPEDAAQALKDIGGPHLMAMPTVLANDVLSMLPEETLYRYPGLWSVAALTRATQDIVGWIAAGERLFATLGDETPLGERMGVANVLAQGYVNRGRLDDCEALCVRLEREFADVPLAAILATFYRYVLATCRGQDVDIASFERDCAPLLASSASKAIVECELVARQFRLHGDRANARRSLQLAVELGQSCGVAVIEAICLAEAAFAAWTDGEDDLFRRYVRELEGIMSPLIAPGLTHFVACTRGTGPAARYGTETLKLRASALIVALPAAMNVADRRRIADEAIHWADQSGQPFIAVLARVAAACAMPGERDADLAAAEQIAAGTSSSELHAAVAALRVGDGAATMLGPLVRRFAERRREGTARVRIERSTDRVSIDGCSEVLRPREAALLSYLALSNGPRHRDVILKNVWPNSQRESAAGSFKTYVSRLRRISGDADLIVLEAGQYRLGKPAIID